MMRGRSLQKKGFSEVKAIVCAGTVVSGGKPFNQTKELHASGILLSLQLGALPGLRGGVGGGVRLGVRYGNWSWVS